MADAICIARDTTSTTTRITTHRRLAALGRRHLHSKGHHFNNNKNHNTQEVSGAWQTPFA